MSSKSLTGKRILLFCAIAFLPFWIVLPILNRAYGGPVYECENAAGAVYALGVFGMLLPALAALITRLATKEGFGASFLWPSCRGNAKYYAASILVPLGEAAACTLLIWALYARDIPFSQAFPFDNLPTRLGALLLQLSASVILFLPAFGEEWGWRGYLMPKLNKLLGRPGAIVAGGILWGLWHAPLTLSGHNFGTDYPLFPWLGIGLMCLMCIGMNALLTLLTQRTGSIYPASFCHMLHNNLGGILFPTLVGSEAFAARADALPPVSVMLRAYLPVLAVTGMISFVILVTEKPHPAVDRKSVP